MDPKITLAWITRRGAHVVAQIKPEELEPRIKHFFAQRVEATAWLGDNRRDVIASVTRPNGGALEDSPHNFWSWWLESPPYDEPRTP